MFVYAFGSSIFQPILVYLCCSVSYFSIHKKVLILCIGFNTQMQYTEPDIITKTCPCNKQRFLSLEIGKFYLIFFFIFFLIFAQNIDCGYTLKLPRRGGSNEYSQSMFWSKNKKNRYTPAYPSFAIYKSGVQGGIHYTDMFS